MFQAAAEPWSLHKAIAVSLYNPVAGDASVSFRVVRKKCQFAMEPAIYIGSHSKLTLVDSMRPHRGRQNLVSYRYKKHFILMIWLFISDASIPFCSL